MALKQNTWTLNQWYDQDVAGNVSYSGAKELYSMGYNTYGALGQNDRTNRSSPVQIPGTNWSRMLTKYSHTSQDIGIIATKTDGTLWSWGNNNDGQLGLNQAQAQVSALSSPTQIGSGTDWGGGGATSLYGKMAALKTDGSLFMWGSNTYSGGLGLNGPTGSGGRYSSPVQLPGTWKTGRDTITGFYDGFLAIRGDGTLWSWGRPWHGSTGQNLGPSPSSRRSSPVQIASGTWSSVCDGGNYNVGAINTDGTLWVWGKNGYGELGLNNTTEYSSPIQVGSDATWHKCSMTESNTLATKTDGTLWAMGRNEFGELGQNNTTSYSSPRQVGSDTTWDINNFQIGMTSRAMKTDGTLWMFGRQDYGQFGNNSQVSYSSPVQIPGEWSSVDGMYRTTFAIKNV